jgi:hypothetical protein
MIQKSASIFLIPLAALALVACNPGGNQSPPDAVANVPAPEVWLESPTEGSQLLLEEVEVQAQVHSPAGQGQVTLQLFVNGGLVQSTDLAVTEHMNVVPLAWQPAEPGEYIVEVRAVVNGISSQPSLAQVRVVEKGLGVIFEADNATVRYGDCTTLRWTAENAQEVALDGEPVPEGGSREVCPQGPSSTYRLTVISLYGEPQERVVTVAVPATPLPPAGVEVTFEADDSNFRQFGDCVTLLWRVKNAQDVQLDGGRVGAEGEQQVCPTRPSNVYRLTVESLEGEIVERTIRINVPATPTPTRTPTRTPTITPIPPSPTRIPTPTVPTPTRVPPTDVPPLPAKISLSASPTAIDEGGQVTLRWHIENVREAYLSGGNLGRIGVAGPDGSKTDRPSGTAQYTLEVVLLNGGTEFRSVNVVVNPAPQPDPEPIDNVAPPAPGISWPVGNVEVCNLSGNLLFNVVLQWGAVSDQSGIRDYRAKVEHQVGGSNWVEQGSYTVGGTTTTVNASEIIECCETYRWRVRASDQANNTGNFSPWSTFKAMNPANCPGVD